MTHSKKDLAILAMTEADIARFEAKVDRGPGQGPNGECHLWVAGLSGAGYGLLGLGRKSDGTAVMATASRIAYFIENGELPPADTPYVLHSCDTPACCNGAHLRAGTQSDNIADMFARGVRRHRIKAQPRGRSHGAAHCRAKLTDEKVVVILDLLVAGQSSASTALQFGVSKQVVLGIWHGRAWKHVPRPAGCGHDNTE